MEELSPYFTDIARQLGYRNVHITFSKRLKKSWKLKSYFTGKKEVTIPHTLSQAPLEVKEAVLHWSHLKRPHLKKHRLSYYRYKKELENVVWQYLRDKVGVSSERNISEKKLSNLQTIGRKYNLIEIFNYLNRTFFNNEIQSYIRWGQAKTKTSYQNWYRLSSGEKVSMITISSLYNHPDIPEFAIKSVVFHEMLHIAIPPYTQNGRRVIHGKEFNKAEQNNPWLQQWNMWEKSDLQRILRSRKY